jgi:hypothetical protein
MGGLVGVSVFAGLMYPWTTPTPSQVKSAGLSALAAGSATATLMYGFAHARQLHEEKPFRQFQRNLLQTYKGSLPDDTVYIAKIAKELKIRASDI